MTYRFKNQFIATNPKSQHLDIPDFIIGWQSILTLFGQIRIINNNIFFTNRMMVSLLHLPTFQTTKIIFAIVSSQVFVDFNL